MTMKPPSAEESLKLAMTELQKNEMLAMMRHHIRRLVGDVLYAVNGNAELPNGGDEWVDREVALCFDRMLSVCSPEMWQALSDPIMDKRTAEHLKMLALQSLTLEAARNPIPQFIRDIAKDATIEPSGKDIKAR